LREREEGFLCFHRRFFQNSKKKEKPHLGEDGEREGVGHAPVGGAVAHAVDEALAVPVLKCRKFFSPL
jgi:hypothetical protein